ncbi:MAG: HipA domain-containing protein [Verrucomicrobia bacterium]|nr:HipA domain-containing protein [Cytophagales bacterium]
MKITCCPATLAEGFETYSLKAKKELFGGKKISHILDLPLPNNLKPEKEISLSNRRISISGVQEKFSLKIEKKKLVLTSAKGEFILKPIPRDLSNVSQVPANEHLTMQIARQVFKLPTAACAMVFFSDGEPAYLTKRFDRKPDGSKRRQEDFASLAEKTSENAGLDYKYEGSYEAIARIIKKFIPAYTLEIEKFYRLVLFNYLFSNGDAHLKNFSVLESDTGEFRLAPAYDLLNTSLHVNDTDLALKDGLFADDFETESYCMNAFFAYDDLLAFGTKIGIVQKRVKRFLAEFVDTTKETQIFSLVKRSFLDETTKSQYLESYQLKIKRFNYSFLKQI